MDKTKNLFQAQFTAFLLLSFLFILGQCRDTRFDSQAETLMSLLGFQPESNQEDPPFTVEPANPDGSGPPVLPRDDFGADGPEAMLDFDPRSVSPYASFRIRFSHSMNISSISADNVQLIRVIDSVGVPISFTWSSPITLTIRPNSQLQQNEEYEIRILDSPAPFTSAVPSENLHAFSGTFRTEPSYPTTISVLSGPTTFPFSNDNSLILSRLAHPSLDLRVDLDPNTLDSIQSLSLCKLGVISSQTGTIPCTDGVARGVLLCSDGNCPASITSALNTLPTSLRATDGVNNYFYRIESFSGRYFYRTVNFVYGSLAPNPSQKINNSANLAIVQASGANAVAGIIEAFARGEFTLKDPADNQNKSLNQYLGSSSVAHPGTVNGKTCLPWPTAPSDEFPNGKLPSGMRYLNRVGPFCGITVSGVIFESSTFPSVNYSATADIYITELELDESVLESGAWVDNVKIIINPENGYMDLTLNGKKAKGRMAIIARVDSIEFFDFLINDSFVFYRRPTGAPVAYPDGDGISFGLNEDPPNTTPRRAFGRTTITANASGEAVIAMNPPAFPEPFNLVTKCGSLPDPVPFPFTFICNPWTTPWSDNIVVSNIIGSGAVAAIVGDVITQKIPEVKPQVVQGVIRDVATKVAPDILNNILGQIKNGITVGLPDYLPNPLNLLQLTIQAQLGTDTTTKKSGSSFGLEGSASASLLTCIKDGSNRCPWDPGYSRPGLLPPTPNALGSNSFVVSKSEAVKLPSTMSRWSANPGVLLSIHPDALNQAFYWLWRSGGLNLRINESFIDEVNNFAGSSTLLRLTKSLLKADPILTVIAPGQNNFNDVFRNDDVELEVTPVVPPFIGTTPLSGGAGNEMPRIALNLSDLKIRVVGRRTDPARGGTPPGTPYTIGTVRISVQSVADLNLGTYQLPTCVNGCSFTPSVLSSVGNPSIQIRISDASGELFYILEVLEGGTYNPLGLRPDAIYQVVEPLVKDLIIPLLNNVVRDIPIPKLRACGLDLTNVKTLPIPGNSPNPYLLLHANAGNYLFTGNCEL